MIRQTGIVKLYDSFLKSLYNNRKRIAYLQFTGMLEDYLTREFAYHIYLRSRHSLFTYTNYSTKRARRFDIVIFDGKSSARKIKGLIEAKYLCNKHRDTKEQAIDNIGSSLASLTKQISTKNIKSYLGRDVLKLRSRSTNIYGLVFASFISLKRKDPEKIDFDKKIYSRAMRLRYHDYQMPYLHKVYDDVKVDILGQNKFASLKVGLWRLR